MYIPQQMLGSAWSEDLNWKKYCSMHLNSVFVNISEIQWEKYIFIWDDTGMF